MQLLGRRSREWKGDAADSDCQLAKRARRGHFESIQAEQMMQMTAAFAEMLELAIGAWLQSSRTAGTARKVSRSLSQDADALPEARASLAKLCCKRRWQWSH
eukprot:TRINITY_DN42632_c0_g1_i1.p2 TRINITY_DN42632_c0_g1~~TRINITY_DN42632_c0_g1_i1.p2  ORF type:complete len:102 (-),score=12.43 TRINITY_DN42632_c0_g1_i1:190-495(-)